MCAWRDLAYSRHRTTMAHSRQARTHFISQMVWSGAQVPTCGASISAVDDLLANAPAVGERGRRAHATLFPETARA
jgi:hypothetical protein